MRNDNWLTVTLMAKSLSGQTANGFNDDWGACNDSSQGKVIFFKTDKSNPGNAWSISNLRDVLNGEIGYHDAGFTQVCTSSNGPGQFKVEAGGDRKWYKISKIIFYEYDSSGTLTITDNITVGGNNGSAATFSSSGRMEFNTSVPTPIECDNAVSSTASPTLSPSASASPTVSPSEPPVKACYVEISSSPSTSDFTKEYLACADDTESYSKNYYACHDGEDGDLANSVIGEALYTDDQFTADSGLGDGWYVLHKWLAHTSSGDAIETIYSTLDNSINATRDENAHIVKVENGVITEIKSCDGITSETASPTVSPSESATPTVSPTEEPTKSPTMSPTASPTDFTPTISPTISPTLSPTASPTVTHVVFPPGTKSPTMSPTVSPTVSPTHTIFGPTVSPTVTSTMPPPGEPFTLIAFKDTSAPVGAATADHYAVVRAHSKLSEDKSENWNGGMIEDPVLSFTKVGQTDKKCWKEILTDTTNASSPVRPIVVWGDREEKNDNGQVIAHAGELRYPTKQEFKTVDAKWDADNVGNVSFAPVQAQLRWLISVNGFGARVISDHGWMITLDGYALNTFSDLVGGGGPNNSSRDEVYAKITNDDPNDITEYETEVECAKENSPSQVRLVVEVGNTGNYKNEIELSYDDDPIQTVDWDFGEIQTDNGESNNTVNFKLENLNGDTDSKFKIDGFRFYSSLDPNGDFKDGEAYGNDQSYDKNGWQITSSKTNGEVRSDANRGWVVKRAVTKSGDVNKSILSGFHQSDEQTYEPSGSTIESCTIQMGSSIGPSARIAGNLMQKIYHNNASNENSNSIEWKLEIDKIYQDKGKKANGETNWVELHDGKITVVCKYKPFEYKYKVKTKGNGQNEGEIVPGTGSNRKVFSYMAEPLSPNLGEWVKNGGWIQLDIGLVNEAIGRL